MNHAATLASFCERSRTTRQEATTNAALTVQEVVNRITPLTVYADELRRLELPLEARNLVEIIVHSTARTARTARSTARMDQRHRITRKPCNPNDLVSAIAREFDPVCRALGIELSSRLSADCRPVMLDLLDLRDGLALLMDVAVDACGLAKGEKGSGVEVQVEPRSDGISLVVGANGEPVSPLVLQQVETAEERGQCPEGGVALALYLARMAAVRAGGDLRIAMDQEWTRFEIRMASIHERTGESLGRPKKPALRVVKGGAIGSREKGTGSAGARTLTSAASRPVLAWAA